MLQIGTKKISPFLNGLKNNGKTPVVEKNVLEYQKEKYIERILYEQ